MVGGVLYLGHTVRLSKLPIIAEYLTAIVEILETFKNGVVGVFCNQ